MSDDLQWGPKTPTGTEAVGFPFWAVVLKLYIPKDILEQNVNKRGERYHSCFREMETHTHLSAQTDSGALIHCGISGDLPPGSLFVCVGVRPRRAACVPASPSRIPWAAGKLLLDDLTFGHVMIFHTCTTVSHHFCQQMLITWNKTSDPQTSPPMQVEATANSQIRRKLVDKI